MQGPTCPVTKKSKKEKQGGKKTCKAKESKTKAKGYALVLTGVWLPFRRCSMDGDGTGVAAAGGPGVVAGDWV